MSVRWPIVALVGLAAPALAQTPPAVEVDIVYGEVGDAELKLDLARPAGPGPFPAVVLLHGGGWRTGNKQDVRGWLPFLAAQGYVAASVGYRLAPGAVFPAQLEDAKTAVRFLRTHAKKYAINPEQVGAIGWSAGGHLAALLGTTDKAAGFEGSLYPDQSSRVQAVVDFFGPADLAGFAKNELAQTGMIGPFIGARYAKKPEAHERASPVNYVTRDDPPFLILHGTRDRVVPIEQSRELAARLAKAGVPVEVVEVADEGHGFTGKADAEATRKTLKFLAERLKK